MKHCILFAAIVLVGLTASAQALTTPAGGGNKRASVSENMGLTTVTITYDRPAVKGRDGKIWGDLVHYGFRDLGFGTSKAAPWRAGANENTVFATSSDVTIEGKLLPAGKYGLFMAVYADSVAVIFSKNHTSWGSYTYTPAEDALRVRVVPKKDQPFVERLAYEFTDQTDNAATVSLAWERWRIPFRVEVDVHGGVLASFRNELRDQKGFNWQNWVQAVNYCLQNNVNLEEALTWADAGIEMPFIGQKNFQTLSAKAQVLTKLNRAAEAEALMKEALPLGSVQELHGYGRSLIAQKRVADALEVFKLNAQKNPNVFTTNVGLARGYSATGDYKTALKYAKAALPQAPDDLNRRSVTGMVEKLTAGQDANN